MNANELADALDWVCENHLVGIGDADFKATATMLRQQQCEIETYKLELYDEVMLRREQQAEIEALKDKLHLTQQSLLIIEGWTK